MRIIIPSTLQLLLEHHHVDSQEFEDDIMRNNGAGVRTRDWMGTKQLERHVLHCLPVTFPRFKAKLDGDLLLIEAMHLGEDGQLFIKKTKAKLVTGWRNIPETIKGAVSGRPLATLFDHPGIGNDIIVNSIDDDNMYGNKTLVFNISMPRSTIRPTTTGVRMLDKPVPDLGSLIARTHDVVPDELVTDEFLADRNLWRTMPDGTRGTCFELRMIQGGPQSRDTLSIRFPYDKDMARTIGTAGMGAWFDQFSKSWKIEALAETFDLLSKFLHEHATFVVDARKGVHVNRDKEIR